MTNTRQLFPLSLAFFTGFLLSLMLYFNGLLSDMTTLFYGSLFFHGFGVIVYTLLAYVLFPTKHVPWNVKYILPGMLNAIVIMGSALAIINLEITVMISVSLLAQLSFSLIIDTFGLLGKEKKPFHKKQLVGLSIICLGVYLLI